MIKNMFRRRLTISCILRFRFAGLDKDVDVVLNVDFDLNLDSDLDSRLDLDSDLHLDLD